MPVLDYAALENGLVTILQADQRLSGVTVDNGQGTPTAEVCPFIGVEVRAWERVPTQLAGGLNQGGPYLETIQIALDCWQFSGQGGSDARGMCFALVDTLLAVLQDNPQVGNQVLLAQALRGEMSTDRVDQSVFARMQITMQAQKFTP